MAGFQGFSGFGGNADVNTSQGLYQLSQEHGGAVAQSAQELMHPRSGILSTISDSFKKGFSNFVDVISKPSEVVAGILSPNMTIKEAIDTHARVSNVLLGDPSKNATTMQKVGSFVVRTAIDVATDPLTYVTFGAARGILGLSSLPKITLGENVVKELKLAKTGEEGQKVISKALSQQGADTLAYLRVVEKQATGVKGLEQAAAKLKANIGPEGVKASKFLDDELKKVASLQAGKLGKKLSDLEGKAYEDLIKKTLEGSLNIDYAKRAMTNFLEHNPGIASTYLDKGGIKFFGKSILTSQRISDVSKLIPGMSLLDHLTAPTRQVISGMFDPAVVKTKQGYVRIPEEEVQFFNQFRSVSENAQIQTLKEFGDLMRVHGLGPNEVNMAVDLFSVYKYSPKNANINNFIDGLRGLDKKQKDYLTSIGQPIASLDMHTGNILTMQKTDKAVSFQGKASGKIGSAEQAAHAAYIAQAPGTGAEVLKNISGIESTLKSLPKGIIDPESIIKNIESKGSVQEASYEFGKAHVAYVDSLLKEGKSWEQIVKDPQWQKMQEISTKIDTAVDVQPKLLGKAEEAINPETGEKIVLRKKLTEDEIKSITTTAEKAIAAKNIKVAALKKEMEQAANAIHENFLGFARGKASELFKGLPVESRDNMKLMLDKIQQDAGINLDILSMVKNRSALLRLQKGAVESTKGMSQEALDRLKTRLAKGEDVFGSDTTLFKEALSKIRIEPVKELPGKATALSTKVKKSPEKLDAEIKKLADQLKTKSFAARRVAMENMFNDKEFYANFINSLRKEFENSPELVGKLLNKISKKGQALKDVLASVSAESQAAAKKISDLPQLERYFVDNKGTIYNRVAASARELSGVGIDIFDTNSATAMATRFLQNTNQGLAREFIQNAGAFFGKPVSEAPNGWIHLDNKLANETANDLTKEMAGLLKSDKGEEIVFHPAVAQAIQDMFKGLTSDPATNDFMKAFDKIQRYWKTSVTSVFPAFHGRNAISNVFLNFMDLGYHAFNPATHQAAVSLQNMDMTANKLAIKAMKTGADSIKAREELTKLLTKDVFTDRHGIKYTFGELRRVIKEQGVALTDNITGSMDIQNVADNYITMIHDFTTKGKVKRNLNIFNLETFAPTKYGRKIGNLIEGQARLVNFLSNLRATGDVFHAAARTKQFLFDYSNLTKFEKTVMRRMIPFYTFTRKNIELQVKSLLSTPGRTAAEITALTDLGDVLSGGGNLTQEQQDALPDWIKSGIGILKSQKGDNIEIYSSLGTPIEQPFQALQFNQLLGSMTPLVRLPIEQMTGYSFFRGKMLSDVTNASSFKNSPQALKDLIGYTEIPVKLPNGKQYTLYKSLRPEMMNLVLQLPPTARVFSTMRQLQTEDVAAGSKLLQATLGLKPYAFDIQQEQAKREKELRTQLEDLLTEAGVTFKFQKVYVPKK